MKENKFKYASASRQIRKQYSRKLEGGFPFWSISLNDSEIIKENLINDCSLSDIRTLKSSIQSQLDFAKQLSLIITITTFFLTFIFSPLTFYLQQSTKAYDWQHDAIMTIVKEEMSEIEDKDKRQNFLLNSTKSLIEKQNEDWKKVEDFHYLQLAIILIPSIAFFLILLFRFKWISSLSECINQTLEEKTIQERKESDLLSKIQIERETIIRRKFIK